MKSKLIILAVGVFLFFDFCQETAQASQRERRVEQEKRESLGHTESSDLTTDSKFVFDYGGWLDFRYDDYDQEDNDSSAADTYDYDLSLDLRLWLRVALAMKSDGSSQKKHSFYFRLKNLYYIDRKPDSTAGGADNDGPHVDYAFMTLDFRPYWLKAGRRYFSVGRGIAYSDVHDGAELHILYHTWGIKGFVSHTLPHQANIDTSVPGYSKASDRFFYGTEISYQGISDHNMYAYFVVQRDHSNPKPQDSLRDYTYNSQYFGVGSHGDISSQMNYWIELIRQTGNSRIYATREKKDIDAWALDCGVSYGFDAYSHPSLSVEYAFASGDKDRAVVTDTENGNTAGDDNNFLHFGYRLTGYALSPRLSNMHLYKISLWANPLEKISFFKEFLFELDYYRYYKDKSSGGISDLEATEDNTDIGSEIDFSISWQIFSDLRCVMQYGYFLPGKAYPSSTNDNQQYFSISATLTF